ncbi:MAG: hypothetical protein LBV67_07130 [Streptococcaceae bacterium]|jgi:replicative DNA helicase|nr:hypothetical protein [Streptococcaceae bacterium]
MHNEKAENYELQLIACILTNPSRLIETHIEAEWFEQSTFKTIAQALQAIKDFDDWTLQDLRKKIAHQDYFTSIYLEDLENLRDLYAKEYTLEQLERIVKTEYLERSFIKAQADFYQYRKDEDSRRLQEIIVELDTMKKPLENGDLAESEKELLEHLQKTEDGDFIKSYQSLDRALNGGILDGQLIVIGARPAGGKSAFAISLGQKIMNRNQGACVDFFALEMTKKQMIHRFIANEGGIHLSTIVNPAKMKPHDKQRAVEAFKNLKNKDLRIFGQNHRTLSSIALEIAKKARECKEKGVKYIPIIDQATLVDVQGVRGDIRMRFIEITRTIKRLTIEYDIPIILLTQLKRADKTKDEYSEPNNSDFKESSSFEEDANVTILLWKSNEHEKTETKVKIAKNRDGAAGSELDFKFIAHFMTFSEQY